MRLFSNTKNIFKLLFQFAVFAALGYMGFRLWFDKSYIPDFEAYCPFGGLQAVGSFLTLGSLSCSMTSMQIMMGIMVFLAAILFSKLFCSFICPIGTISEWIGKLGDKLNMRITVGENADSSLRAVKYILLFSTFYFTLTSSELFCKKFDPYYAIVSGFNTDVVLIFAIISLVIFLIDILRYSWWFLGIAFVFVILSLIGIDVPFIVPLIVISCTGYILEIVRMKKVSPSLLRITRNPESCTSCKKCTNSCPQGIEVSEMEVVNHVDCSFCSDCVYACPEKNTLLINRKNMKWLPAVIVTVLIISGFIIGSILEFPTIDVKWGTGNEVNSAGIFTKSGLKNIKCFGSSTVLANKLRNIDGIYGVSTFVGTNTVKILYNKAV
jgi:polyferredoxin